MPLVRQSLYAQNINLYLAPTADGRETWLPLMQTVGFEGRCFVVSSNMCARRRQECGAKPEIDHHKYQIVTDEYGNEIVAPASKSDGSSNTAQPNGSEVKAPPKILSAAFDTRGGSCIVSPFGFVLAGPQWEDEHGIIYADVDFDECIRGRLDLDVAGSYSRYGFSYTFIEQCLFHV